MRLLLLLLACLAAPAWAQERILRHDVDVRVHADGRLDVAERIEVAAEGRVFRHGLVRDIPLRFDDLQGDAVVADVEIRDVRRDGRPVPWRTTRTGRVLRLHVGDDRHLPVPSQPVFTLHYRTTRQPVFGAVQDAVALAGIGGDQPVATERASVMVHLPAAVAIGAMQAQSTTGADGVDARVALSSMGSAQWTTSGPLPPHAGFDVRLAFPKGVIADPGAAQRVAWWLQDRRGLLVALAGLVLLAGWCLLRWRRVRRSTRLSAVPVRREPPPGFSPAGLRFVRRMRPDPRGFAADLLAAAVDAHLRIVRVPQGARTGWRIERTRAGAHALPTLEQRAQLVALLPEPGAALDLRRHARDRIAGGCRAHTRALRRRFVPSLFRPHRGSVLGAVLIAVASAVAALMLAWHTPALPATVLVVALMLPMLAVFATLVRTPTAEGQALLRDVEGLRRYLGGAIKAGRGHDGASPVLDAARYVRLLPYAVALEVEDAWTQAFVASAGQQSAVATLAGLDWYRGIDVTDPARFSRSMGTSLTARIAASLRPKRRPRAG